MSEAGRYLKGLLDRGRVEAQRSGSSAVEAEHLLLAMAAQRGTTAHRVLDGAGLDYLTVQAALEREFAASLRVAGVALADFDLPAATADPHRAVDLGTSAKLVVERAVKAAGRGPGRLRPEHLLLGVLDTEVGTVPRALALAGVNRVDLIARTRAATEHGGRSMRLRGVNYDVGIEITPQYHSRPRFDPTAAARDLTAIRDELHANAVRISGTDPERLAAAGRIALDLGLEVWLAPQLHDRGAAELIEYTTRCAELAEGLRRDAPALVFLVGSELTLFSGVILGGDNVLARLRNPLTLLRLKWFGSHNKPLNGLLAELERATRAVFHGPVSYASVPLEAVDWSRFDAVGVDYYRAAKNRDTYGARLARHFGAGKPVVVTELGCGTYRGAQDRGAMAWSIVDPTSDPPRFFGTFQRDEELQAREVVDMLDTVAGAGVEGAFVFTFAAPALTHSDDPGYDLDLASYALVKTYPDGSWRPKAAYRGVAEYYADLAGRVAG